MPAGKEQQMLLQKLKLEVKTRDDIQQPEVHAKIIRNIFKKLDI